MTGELVVEDAYRTICASSRPGLWCCIRRAESASGGAGDAGGSGEFLHLLDTEYGAGGLAAGSAV